MDFRAFLLLAGLLSTFSYADADMGYDGAGTVGGFSDEIEMAAPPAGDLPSELPPPDESGAFAPIQPNPADIDTLPAPVPPVDDIQDDDFLAGSQEVPPVETPPIAPPPPAPEPTPAPAPAEQKNERSQKEQGLAPRPEDLPKSALYYPQPTEQTVDKTDPRDLAPIRNYPPGQMHPNKLHNLTGDPKHSQPYMAPESPALPR